MNKKVSDSKLRDYIVQIDKKALAEWLVNFFLGFISHIPFCKVLKTIPFISCIIKPA